MKCQNIREEETKNKVAQDFFKKFDCTNIVGNIDFAVRTKDSENFLLWAEAKKDKDDILEMLTQLVLTIGKARTFDKIIPPPFLGCFDCEKIAFIPYSEIQHIFYQNDFNWKVTPSNRTTKEFQQVLKQVKKVVENDITWQTYIFDFGKDKKELHQFIKNNFIDGKLETTQIEITEYNFVHVFYKWLEYVKPTIVVNWEKEAYKYKIYERDFFLADLISENDETIEKLLVLLHKTYYKTEVNIREGFYKDIDFTDGGTAHRLFWSKYSRPPKDIYRTDIKNRQDLLVLPNFRERNGAFFTPRIWVEKSQEYIAEALGENWQDEYYIWDCAAGTGNLLQGLINPLRIYASTIDSGDVKIMHEDIATGHSILFKNHVFQFDFLNDDFSTLPNELQKIINDEKRREKLIIYINPPYAEASNRKTIVSKGENKSQVSTTTKTYKEFQNIVGTATRELFAQFFLRIYKEIPDCKLASFSTLKYVSAQYFYKFRQYFKTEFKTGFVCKANSFDNVKGNFPIGFSVLDLATKKEISKIKVDVYDNDKDVSQSYLIGKKNFYAHKKGQYIIDWLKKYHDKKNDFIAYLRMQGTDIQNNLGVFIVNKLSENDIKKHLYTFITVNNIIELSVYFTVRKVITATWLNDRDQFLYPNKKWEKDIEFQNDCLAYTIFNNNISAKNGVNHWIPFYEKELNVHNTFDSHTILSFISGKIIQNGYTDLFEHKESEFCIKCEFSPEATEVFNAGRQLWLYYHGQDKKYFEYNFGKEKYNVNVGLYDIREYFQGRNENGRMNINSEDKKYNELIATLREKINILADKLIPKIYQYGFLIN